MARSIGHTVYFNIANVYFLPILLYHLFVLENIISITKTMVDIPRPTTLIIKAGKIVILNTWKILDKYLGQLLLG